MEAIARARFQRISPRKARVVLREVQGKNVAEALAFLKFTPRSAAQIVTKTLDSAIANAMNERSATDLDRLHVIEAYADKAPDRNMRRWRPRAMGRATQIKKGMSHITIVVGEK